MNCREMEERIALQVSGDLDPHCEPVVEEHLGSCENCARLAAELWADLEKMRALRGKPADEAALAAVRLSVLAELESRRARTLSPVAWILASSNVRWAAAAVVILLVAIAGLRHGGDTVTPPRKADLAGTIGVPAERAEPVSKPAAKEPGRPLSQAATVRATVKRTTLAALPHGNVVQREAPPVVQEDRPSARQVQIIDSNANTDPLSPAATLVKLKSSDPNVVLYWLVESNGG